ncbi:MAG: hypothetical protein EOO52_08310 [Gammaproteobacteria bacterium]|nr:MAG: hypothetical protein EOO52_08310 [Gammaproteobacteria bacterium]
MYAWEKFYLAARTLNESGATPRKSLENAFVHNILVLNEADIPDQLLQQFKEINALVTLPEGVPPIAGHNGCSYAISALSDDQVASCIQKIKNIYLELEKINKENA